MPADLTTFSYVFEAEPFNSDVRRYQLQNFQGMGFVFEAEPFMSAIVERYDVDQKDDMQSSIYVDVDVKDSLIVQVAAPAQANISLSPSSPSNPTAATVIINGSYIYQNAATDPMTQSGAPPLSQVQMVNLNFVIQKVVGGGTISACDLLQFNLNLTQEGGTFSFVSKAQFALEGDAITIAGIPAFVTRSGTISQGSLQGYKQKGIIGFKALHRPITFVAFGQKVSTALVPNQAIPIFPSSQWQTCAGLAQAIGAAANSIIAPQGTFTVQWMCRDMPVTDLTPEVGGTVIDALRSLAARVGAIVRFDFINTYEIVYPDQSYFQFSVPNCRLVGPNGAESEFIYDVETGFLPGGSGPTIVSTQSTVYTSGSHPLPDALIGNNVQTDLDPFHPAIQEVDTNTKLFTQADAPKMVSLPVNFKNAYIQHLCPNSSVGFACTTRNVIGRNPNGTTIYDQGVWTPVAVQWNNVGGNLVPQVQLDYTLFPPAGVNPDIDNQNFTTTIGCSLLPRPNASSDAGSKQREATGILNETFRFLRVAECNLQTVFWGVIPQPGKWFLGLPTFGTSAFWSNRQGDAIPGSPYGVGITSTFGTIDTVDISLPGYMQIGTAQYRLLVMVSPTNTFTARITQL